MLPSRLPRRAVRALPSVLRFRHALLLPALLAAPRGAAAQTDALDAQAAACARTLTANVVAFDQPIFYNRLGAFDPAGMMYALRRDVVPRDPSKPLGPGNVMLRPDKRPRPIVLRMNVGDCLRITFQNLLAPTPVDNQQPATRTASIHVAGLQLVTGIQDDGSNVGTNASSLVPPGGTATYTLYAEREGTHLLYSTAATTGGEGDGGSLARGLFGAVNVEPRGAEWYRSQLTAEEMALAIARNPDGTPKFTPAHQPVIDYDAVYPAGHRFAGLPILRMLNGTEIVHTDLTAIITGPNKGRFPDNTYPTVAVNRDRHQPFREFTIIFHDEIGIVQAFPEFDDPQFEFTLHGGRDGFAINYGTGGIGAEVLANRFGVGPMWDCNECKYEEFFLSSWAVGDPAMVVDIPANARDAQGRLIRGPKATKALYPDDPSNVYHSYLNDHVKIRNLHAGPKEHHIFHLHAHQWIHTPDADNSTYLDSQAIAPGSAFTYEAVYDGGGNRNKTPGDAIFHCHFYPHFAQGMWGLWRVHDVFEFGTQLDADGRPVAGARALPDGEIAAGTPIPGVVPIPGQPLPVMPGTDGNVGYPFYIPGVAGHRPPKPPLETVFDGGLPRHVVVDGVAQFPQLNTRDFRKENVTIQARPLPEAGTSLEQGAMAFHARRHQPTYRVDPVTFTVVADTFLTNGLPPIAGAPYADPCVRDDGQPVDTTRFLRVYKAASFQIDAKYNKAGWHFPQHRMFALWQDVDSVRTGRRPPEPLFFRVNSGECVRFHLVNLIPKEYQMDDFQVRTPTDVIGQHIHLVKFDVTSSDGAANGFNYEDGSFAPDETVERIRAIRRFNQCTGLDAGDSRDGTFTCPVARAHPFFGPGPNNAWLGAQETIQRWWADDVLNAAGRDRTLRTVFTHDHFGPSTHQQAGLYAGLVTEPAGSRWRDPETGAFFGGRADGGPTSWRADILTDPSSKSYREFNLLFADFTLAYQDNGGVFPDPANAINPPGRFEVGLPFLLAPPVDRACPNGEPAPCPELISADDPGTMTVNYRNEPIALRIRNPSTNAQDTTGLGGDLAHAFRSDVTRADPRFNVQPTFYRPLTGGLAPGDPFTPLMRAYQGDLVQIRILVGAHEEGHNFAVHGNKWLFEPAFANSGYRSSQMMGISEHFEFVLPRMPRNTQGSTADYLWQAGAATDDVWNGLWGILRTYRQVQQDLQRLPNNERPDMIIANAGDFDGVCPRTAPVRSFDVTAVTARDALPDGTLIYNRRAVNGGPLHDPTAILYVPTEDLDAAGRLRPGAPIEPLVLRANAGDCIDLTLRNRLPERVADLPGFNTLPMIVNRFNANQIRPSSHVGLHPQLLFLDVTRDDGTNVGLNPVQTVAPGQFKRMKWYAGALRQNAAGDSLFPLPIELGTAGLVSADRIKHGNKGALAALIVEPTGASWITDAGTRAQATVTLPDGRQFREFVLFRQTDVNLRFGSTFTARDLGSGARTFRAGDAVPNLAEAEDPEDSGQKAYNYRTEPFWFRMGFAPDEPLSNTRSLDFTNVLTNAQVGGDPETPIFTAAPGQAVRLRLAEPLGHPRNGGFQIHGHIWDELPYRQESTVIGRNALSEWKGIREGLGPSSHFDLLPRRGAGGAFRVTGDFLYRDQQSFFFDGGLWGLLRVRP